MSSKLNFLHLKALLSPNSASPSCRNCATFLTIYLCAFKTLTDPLGFFVNHMSAWTQQLQYIVRTDKVNCKLDFLSCSVYLGAIWSSFFQVLYKVHLSMFWDRLHQCAFYGIFYCRLLYLNGPANQTLRPTKTGQACPSSLSTPSILLETNLQSPNQHSHHGIFARKWCYQHLHGRIQRHDLCSKILLLLRKHHQRF